MIFFFKFRRVIKTAGAVLFKVALEPGQQTGQYILYCRYTVHARQNAGGSGLYGRYKKGAGHQRTYRAATHTHTIIDKRS